MNTINILIVDDDIYSNEALKLGISWDNVGIENIFTSTSVEEAIKIVQHEIIHIIICDIEMPRDNGFVFLNWLTEYQYDVIVILYSCHADFNYAKKAVQSSVFDYILKPSQYNDIEDCLKKAVDRVKVIRKEQEKNQLAEGRERAFVERFYAAIIKGTIPPQIDEITRIANMRHINIELSLFVLPVLCKIDNLEAVLLNWNLIDIEFIIKNSTRDIFNYPWIKNVTVVPYRDHIYIILFSICDDMVLQSNMMRDGLNSFAELFTKVVKEKIYCFYNNPIAINELFFEVNNAYNAMLNHINSGIDIVYIKDMKENNNAVAIDTKNWYSLLLNRQYDLLNESIVNYLNLVKSRGNLNIRFLEKFFYEYTQVLYSALSLKNVHFQSLVDNAEILELKDRALLSHQGLINYIEKVNRRAVDALIMLDNESSTIEKIKQYIKENIDKEITREELSTYVCLNADYMSRLIKKTIGISLIEYITSKKMERAKELLHMKELNISMVAEKTGYDNLPYFCKIFKRIVGVTPKQYRRDYLSGRDMR